MAAVGLPVWEPTVWADTVWADGVWADEGTPPPGSGTLDRNTAMRSYLQTRYSVSNQDLTTLINRYVRENPNNRNDVTKIRKDLETAAGI